MGTSWQGLKREAGWRKSVLSSFGLRRLGALVSC
jgi:hypothetical protein